MTSVNASTADVPPRPFSLNKATLLCSSLSFKGPYKGLLVDLSLWHMNTHTAETGCDQNRTFVKTHVKLSVHKVLKEKKNQTTSCSHDSGGLMCVCVWHIVEHTPRSLVFRSRFFAYISSKYIVRYSDVFQLHIVVSWSVRSICIRDWCLSNFKTCVMCQSHRHLTPHQTAPPHREKVMEVTEEKGENVASVVEGLWVRF